MEKIAARNFLIRYGNLDFKLRSESNPPLDPTLGMELSSKPSEEWGGRE